MPPSHNLDEHTLWSCIRNIIRITKGRGGSGHVPNWILPQRIAPLASHPCQYIFTLPADPQIIIEAQNMIEAIKLQKDDASRALARARIASMVHALGLEVVEVPEHGNCLLCAKVCIKVRISAAALLEL